MSINLEYYRIFYEVANQKSITGAARVLCISQPAVSQAVKTLETDLSSTLFLRTAKGVLLTEEGETLYSYVKQGYETILLGEDAIKRMKNLELGEIRIGASDMTLKYYLLPYLQQFHELYPKIKVKVTNGPTPETMDDLHEGKIDFGIVSEPFTALKQDEITRVMKIRDVFIAGHEYQQLRRKRLTRDELENLPVICLESNTSSRTYVDLFLKDLDIVLKPEFELATSDMIVQFALRNLGIGIVAEPFARPYLESAKLIELPLERPIPPRNFCLVENSRFKRSAAADKLISLFFNRL